MLREKNFHLYILFFILTFCSVKIVAQTSQPKDSLLVESNNYLYKNPKMSLKIANYIIQNPRNNEVKNEAVLLKIKSLIVTKNYSEAIKLLADSEKNNANHNQTTKDLLLIEILIDLNLKKEAQLILQDFDKKEQNPEVDFFKILTNNRSNQENELKKLLQKIESKNHRLESKINLELGKIYQENKNYKLAKDLYSSILSDQQTEEIFQTETKLLLAELLYDESNFSESFKILTEFTDKTNLNELDLIKLNDLLSKNYIELNQKEKANQPTNFAIKSLEKLTNKNQQARVKIIELIKIRTEKNQNVELKFLDYLILGLIIISIISLIIYILKKIKTKRKSEIETIIIEEKNSAFVIPEKTESILMEKLKKFENQQLFLNANLSLNSLAKDLQSNTSYLSEVINKHQNKNFKTYINELRINYIIDKLKNNPEYLTYKIDYLAKESGFLSRTSFTVIFKSVTGISPSLFIENIKKEKEL